MDDSTEMLNIFLHSQSQSIQRILTILDIIYKEIVTQNNAYAHQQLGIYRITLEYIVYVRAVTAELTSKPRNRTLLPSQLCLNTTSDMQHWLHIIAPRFSKRAH